MNGIGQNFRAPENNTTESTIENNSLPMHRHAWHYQTQTTKKPAVTRAYVVFLLFSARQYETSNHSHSIVAGGLPEMSYTTRLIPRTSLMMRLETLPSSSYGRCAQCAVMKSLVTTARSDTTHS